MVLGCVLGHYDASHHNVRMVCLENREFNVYINRYRRVNEIMVVAGIELQSYSCVYDDGSSVFDVGAAGAESLKQTSKKCFSNTVAFVANTTNNRDMKQLVAKLGALFHIRLQNLFTTKNTDVAPSFVFSERHDCRVKGFVRESLGALL